METRDFVLQFQRFKELDEASLVLRAQNTRYCRNQRYVSKLEQGGLQPKITAS